MDRVAVFVDAGYLYAGGAKSLTGSDDTKRHEISLDIPVVIQYLIRKAEDISQHKLLRIYWYDAAPSGRLTTDHQILASSDNVKLRLGVINGFGQQKGVDGKVLTDLAELSRNRAFADAVLLGGDEDLRIGVELAQEYGTRVHLLTIEGASSSPTLRQESDTLTTISNADIHTFLKLKAKTVPANGLGLVASPAVLPISIGTSAPDPSLSEAEPRASVGDEIEVTQIAAEAADVAIIVIETEVKTYLAALPDAERVSLASALTTGPGVPSEHDGRLLARLRKLLARPLDQSEKLRMRLAVRKELGA